MQFVFGYGSLTASAVRPSRAFAHRGFVADLDGFTRGWGVAMDNTRDLPGYKHYLDSAGDRSALYVCFLDLVPSPGSRVNGVCLPVDDAGLRVLDHRERNYVRRDVTGRLRGGGGPARVWTYLGSAAGRARLATGRAAGTAVVDAGYLEAVRAGFAALGTEEFEAAAPTLEPGDLPVRALTRVDVP